MRNSSINKWHALVGSFFSYMFDAMDIILLAVSLTYIMNDFDMNLTQGGLLGTATLIGIGISSVVVGWYSDNYGRRKALLWSLVLFGVLTAAISLSPNWYVLLLLRFLSGLGLGGVWGILSAYIVETWPAKHRGRAAAFVLSSFPAGAGMSALLAAIIIPAYGWRGLFVAGAGSIIAAVYVYFFMPESEEWTSQQSERQNNPVSVTEVFSADLIKITFFATASATFALMAYWGSTTWIPTFLTKERGLDEETMFLFVIILNVGMFIGYNLFGYLSDIIGRKNAIILSFIGTTITLPIYVITENTNALLWLGPVYAFFISFAGLFGSYFGELYPTRVRTIGAGFCFSVGRGLSAFSPVLLGFIATKFGLAVGIGICAVFFFLAAVMMLFLPSTVNKEKLVN